MRTGKISGGLLTALVLLLLIAGGFWGWRLMGQAPPPTTGDSQFSDVPVRIYCGGCGKVTEMPFSEAQQLPENEDQFYKCPKCGEFKAEFARPGSSVIAVPVPG